MKEMIPGEHLDEAEIIRSKGEAPQQIEIDDDPVASVKGGKKRAAVVSDDYDDDGGIFGDGAAFNDDELDLEGFEISEGNPYE